MKLGVALDGSGSNYSQTCLALSQLRKLGIIPDAYAVSVGQTDAFFGDLLQVPPWEARRELKRASMKSFDDLPCPVVICAKSLLQNRDIAFGSEHLGFQPAPLSVLTSLSEARPFRIFQGKVLSIRFIHSRSLLQALNKMGCERYLVIGTSAKKREDTARCLYLDYPEYGEATMQCQVVDSLRRDYNRICQFLYFS